MCLKPLLVEDESNAYNLKNLRHPYPASFSTMLIVTQNFTRGKDKPCLLVVALIMLINY